MGQLLRIIIILIGLWLIIQIIKRAFASQRVSPPSPPPVTKMLACARCGVHIPESQVIYDRDKIYCCEEHRRQG